MSQALMDKTCKKLETLLNQSERNRILTGWNKFESFVEALKRQYMMLTIKTC